MEISNIFFGLAAAAVVANVVILILIMAALDRRGHETNILLARLYIFKYISAYKEATRKETGKPGRLYGLWILTINLALVLALAGFLSRGNI
ncbi:MAG: hypothetical protein JXE07_05130 [Candidatus Aminicenantes bacterium]|nr:hypothetical protein [Candidatus Aminicenantes bacterium]